MRLVKITILTLIIALCASVLCFATDEETPDFSSVVSPYSDEYSEYLGSGAKVAYDVNDVYLLLNNYFKGSMYNSSNSTTSVFPLVRIAAWTQGIYEAVYGTSSGQNNIDNIADALYYFPNSSSSYSLAELQGMTWGYAGDINSKLSLTNSYLNSLSSKYNWLSTSSSVQWYLNSSRQVISSSQSGSAFSAVFNNFYSTSSLIPILYRIYVPFMNSNLYDTSSDFDLSVGYFDPSNNNITSVSSDIEYFLEPTTRGTYIYLFGFRPHNVSYVSFTLSGAVQFDSNYSGSVSYLTFNSDEYQLIKTAFYQAKSANSFGSIEHNVQLLADRFIDSDVQAAEQASQGVIDDTLTGFTGNGSAAAKVSDSTAMKNMSGSVQSGLSTGASASNATSVFSNTTFWSWFTQATSNGINNAYPAPTVTQTRDGDQVVDFLSRNENDLHDLLNQRDSW